MSPYKSPLSFMCLGLRTPFDYLAFTFVVKLPCADKPCGSRSRKRLCHSRPSRLQSGEIFCVTLCERFVKALPFWLQTCDTSSDSCSMAFPGLESECRPSETEAVLSISKSLTKYNCALVGSVFATSPSFKLIIPGATEGHEFKSKSYGSVSRD